MVTGKKIFTFMSHFETQILVFLRQTLLMWHDYPSSNLLKNITVFIRFIYSLTNFCTTSFYKRRNKLSVSDVKKCIVSYVHITKCYNFYYHFVIFCKYRKNPTDDSLLKTSLKRSTSCSTPSNIAV